MKRLAQIVVSTYFEARDAIHQCVSSCHHDDRNRVMFAQVARKAQAVFARHPQVEQCELYNVLAQEFACLDAIGCKQGIEPMLRQVLRGHIAKRRLIIDD